MDFYLSKFLLSKENLAVVQWLDIICAVILIVLGIIHLLLCVFGVGSFRKRKSFFLLEGFSVALINLSIILTMASVDNIFISLSFPVFLVALTVLIYLPISFFDERVIVITDKERELVRAIDKSMEEEGDGEENSFARGNEFLERVEKALEEKKVERIAVKKVKEDVSVKEELNFEHVKNVLERLNYFNLSPSDKKTVSELKSLLFLAENSGVTKEFKSKINDGLSSLLKIMSKYSV